MRINKKYFFFSLYSVFILYGINNYIFERSFFFNEILAFIGVVLFVEKTFKNYKSNKAFIPQSNIYKLVLGIIVLGFIHLFISIFTKTNWYFYFRNSVIVYSIFSFFIGFYLFDRFKGYIEKAKYPLLLYVIYGFVFPAITIMDRFTSAAIFPFLFKKLNWLSISGIVALDLLLAYRYDSLTVVLVPSILIAIFFTPSYKRFKVLTGLTFIVVLIGFGSFYSNVQLYKAHPQNIYDRYAFRLFGNIEEVANSNFILGLDGNSTWRVVFWTRLITERFPENIVGIGFGTPLVNFAKHEDTVSVEHDDFHDVHVTGGHNTYLTLAIRMGAIFLLFIWLIYREVFYEFYTYKQYYMGHKFGLFFLSFFSISIIGLFNLVLETPTVASTFWILLGVVAASIYKRRTHAN